jgi:hypothetical protein
MAVRRSFVRRSDAVGGRNNLEKLVGGFSIAVREPHGFDFLAFVFKDFELSPIVE